MMPKRRICSARIAQRKRAIPHWTVKNRTRATGSRGITSMLITYILFHVELDYLYDIGLKLLKTIIMIIKLYFILITYGVHWCSYCTMNALREL